ncbi:MAG: S-layer homology domain-containing protein, partial [Oscillospiraceae bacterium]|nr:S-layer homology domain-containing protein [Oscillospiraceae bacterium]
EPDSAGTVSEIVTIDPRSRGDLAFQAQWVEGARGVDFRAGDHGSFANGETVVSFNGLEEKPLGEQEAFAIPQATAAQGYTFRGWRLTGDTTGKLYTAAEIGAMTPAVGRTVFTAQYEQRRTPGGNAGTGTTQKPDDTTTWLERDKHEAYIIGRDDGLVAPEANITRAEVATIFYRLLTAERQAAFATRENPFQDVEEGDWFFGAVTALAKAGIVEGRPGGYYAPEDNITRGEFATIAARFLSESTAPRTYFSDISGHWAEEYINRAAQVGWIKGYPDGSFRPDNNITRAEVISLVNAVLGRKPHKDGLHRDMVTWQDNMDPTRWYYLEVQEATNSHEYIIKTIDGKEAEEWTALL